LYEYCFARRAYFKRSLIEISIINDKTVRSVFCYRGAKLRKLFIWLDWWLKINMQHWSIFIKIC